MTTLTAKEFAARVNSDGRTVRKFLRADAKANGTEAPGKGSRWTIEAKQVRSLTTRFNAWKAANEAKAAEKANEDEVPEEVIEDEESIEDDPDTEPNSDEELEEPDAS